jgi:amidase
MKTPADDILALSALELAEEIRLGKLSSEEVTRAYLDRIGALNPSLGAFVSVFAKRSLWSARRKDRVRGERPLFHGVPIAIKDLNFVRWSITRLGSPAHRFLFSPVDDANVARIRAGGFVMLGKTATSELGILPAIETSIHPPGRNPWNREHSPGGSSGGAAAAVSARLVPIAHGSDGGGSVRIPASFCGLYGFKPSRGRVPYPDRAVRELGMGTSGSLARTVHDAAALFEVMRSDLGPRDIRAQLEVRRSAALKRRGLRIRLATQGPLAEVKTDPAIREAVQATARVLEKLGHTVEESALPAGSLEEFLPLYSWMVAHVPLSGGRRMQPVTRWLSAMGKRLAWPAVRSMRDALTERMLLAFDGADLLLTPTVPVLPPRVGEIGLSDAEGAFRAFAPLGAFTAPFNISGQPAASIPAGMSQSGLPIGVQVVGRLEADDDVLGISYQLEEAAPWRHRVAPLAGGMADREL